MQKKISKPITRVSGKYDSAAVEAFQSMTQTLKHLLSFLLIVILGYCQDRKTSKTPYQHALALVNIILDAPADYKDEIFLQVVKQLTNNPSP